jgi:shikimate kinase
MSSKKSSVIILVGMMGSGKSTVGLRLAQYLGFKFIDTDEMIVDAENSSIINIFKNKGEGYFRDLEKNILNQIETKNIVIATGGGLPIHSNNMRKLMKLGSTVYLAISPAEIYFRLKDSNDRPLLPNNISSIKELLNLREKIYSMASYQLDCTGKKTEELVEEIINNFNY